MNTLSFARACADQADAHANFTLCTLCGERTLNGSLCFGCHVERHGQRYTFYASVPAEGEDATERSRVADGSAKFNLGLPPVEKEIGYRANGTKALDSRPITNNELPTKRAREDYAKRHGLVPISAPKRAIGGR